VHNIQHTNINKQLEVFMILCEGNDTVGAYWNVIQLQGYIDAHRIGNLENIQFSAAEDVRTFLNELSLVHTISEVAFPVIAEKYSQLALDEWNALGNSDSRRNLTNTALKELDATLLKIKIVDRTAQSIHSNLAVFVDNIWKTGSEGIVFMEENTDRNKSAMTLMENTSSSEILSKKPR
jgi:hypothetical protein